MNPAPNFPPENERDQLVDEGLTIIRHRDPDFSDRWLLVAAASQCLFLLEGTRVKAQWPVSTAATGLDNRQDSGGTPPGLHRIDRKIGEGAEQGTIFESRQSTGIMWRSDPVGGSEEPPGDLILTRILTLTGLEDGINRGPGVDSRERYIYIHGTNHEDGIGCPVSGGCVRLTSSDVTDLFDQVDEGDPVVIL